MANNNDTNLDTFGAVFKDTNLSATSDDSDAPFALEFAIDYFTICKASKNIDTIYSDDTHISIEDIESLQQNMYTYQKILEKYDSYPALDEYQALQDDFMKCLRDRFEIEKEFINDFNNFIKSNSATHRKSTIFSSLEDSVLRFITTPELFTNFKSLAKDLKTFSTLSMNNNIYPFAEPLYEYVKAAYALMYEYAEVTMKNRIIKYINVN